MRIGGLEVDLTANSAGFAAAMQGAAGSANQMAASITSSLRAVESQVSTTRIAVGTFIGTLATGIVGAAVGQITELVRSIQTAVPEIGRMARQLEISTDALQVYMHAARMAGATQDEMTGALQHLYTEMQKAARGDADAIRMFNALGVGVLDAQGKLRGLVRVNADVAESISKLTTQYDRAQAMQNAYGGSSERLQEALVRQRGGWAQVEDAARRAGVVLGGDYVRQSEDAARRSREFDANLQTLATAFRNYIVPAIQAAVAVVAQLTEGFDRLWARASIGAIDSRLRELAASPARAALQQYRDAESGVSRARGMVGLSDHILAQPLTQEQRQTQLAIRAEREAALRRAEEAFARQRTESMRFDGQIRAEFAEEDRLLSQREQHQAFLEGRAPAVGTRLPRPGMAEDVYGPSRPPGGRETGTRNPPIPGEGGDPNALREMYDRLRASLNPLTAAQIQYGEAVTLATYAQAQGLATEAERNALIGQARDRYNEARISAAGLSGVIENALPPAERYRQQVAELNRLLAEGAITQATYNDAIDRIGEAYDQASGTARMLRQAGKDAAGAFGELVSTIASGSATATDALKKFALALAEIAFRIAVLRPIERGLETLVGGLFRPSTGSPGSTTPPAGTMPAFGSSATFGAAGAAPFALGGIMTAHGPLPLRRYAAGGIATGPQLALFGEGSMNEAFVPLDDGRSIPVTMRGGGGTTVVVNVDARGADPGAELRLRAVSRQIAAEAAAAVFGAIDGGGRAAKAAGRR